MWTPRISWQVPSLAAGDRLGRALARGWHGAADAEGRVPQRAPVGEGGELRHRLRPHEVRPGATAALSGERGRGRMGGIGS